MKASAVDLMPGCRIEPLGDQAFTLTFGDAVDPVVNQLTCTIASHIASRNFPFVADVVPSFCTVGVHYHVERVLRLPGETIWSALVRQMQEVVATARPHKQRDADGPVIEIPVCYTGEHGMDVEQAAAQADLSAEQLVRLHQTEDALRVYMVGFAPGNPYIGLLPEQFGIPRRPTPRTSVPAGSVGVANRQTVIYPVEAPGGWNIIGCTPLKLFDPGRESPCLLKPGDRVRFKAISQDQFLELRGGA